MSDISSLIMNQIKTALEALHHSGVGFIDAETTEGFDYKIDNRTFNIQAEAEGFVNDIEYCVGNPARFYFIDTMMEIYPEVTMNTWLWVYEFERCEKPEGWCI